MEEPDTKKCGYCRSPTTASNGGSRSSKEELRMGRILTDIFVNQVRIRCIYACNGCDEKPSRGQLDDHEKECAFETTVYLKTLKQKCIQLVKENDELRKKQALHEIEIIDLTLDD
jgi:hypothetical protein